jgi:hypothetical protein
MEDLEKLFRRYARRKAARWWVGERPVGRDGAPGRSIASRLGYPTGDLDPFATDRMVRLTRDQAAHVLAVAGTLSLVMDTYAPGQGRLEEARAALAGLKADATFLSNGYWGLNGDTGWIPLTKATFDSGVIGYDAARAFIFWVEEED